MLRPYGSCRGVGPHATCYAAWRAQRHELSVRQQQVCLCCSLLAALLRGREDLRREHYHTIHQREQEKRGQKEMDLKELMRLIQFPKPASRLGMVKPGAGKGHHDDIGRTDDV
jgi:hypothetical protein